MQKIRILAGIEADADELLGALRRMPSARIDTGRLVVHVRAVGGRRGFEPYTLLGVVGGDGTEARVNVAQLARQNRIDSETERDLLRLIGDLEHLTK